MNTISTRITGIISHVKDVNIPAQVNTGMNVLNADLFQTTINENYGGILYDTPVVQSVKEPLFSPNENRGSLTG